MLKGSPVKKDFNNFKETDLATNNITSVYATSDATYSVVISSTGTVVTNIKHVGTSLEIKKYLFFSFIFFVLVWFQRKLDFLSKIEDGKIISIL